MSLGDIPNMYYEIDRSTIVERNGIVFLRMRVRVPDGGRVGVMISNLSVHCNRGFIQVESGQMGYESSRLIPFKGEDLDQDSRIIVLPAPSAAFNNMYSFVC
jgi:hypothetical protein